MLVQNYVGRWPLHQARWFCLSASRIWKHRRTSKTILDSLQVQYILSKMIVESTTASLTCPPPQPQQPPWRPPNTFHLAAQVTIRQKLYRSRFLKIFWSIPWAAHSPQEMGKIQTNAMHRGYSVEQTLLNRNCTVLGVSRLWAQSEQLHRKRWPDPNWLDKRLKRSNSTQ